MAASADLEPVTSFAQGLYIVFFTSGSLLSNGVGTEPWPRRNVCEP